MPGGFSFGPVDVSSCKVQQKQDGNEDPDQLPRKSATDLILCQAYLFYISGPESWNALTRVRSVMLTIRIHTYG